MGARAGPRAAPLSSTSRRRPRWAAASRCSRPATRFASTSTSAGSMCSFRTTSSNAGERLGSLRSYPTRHHGRRSIAATRGSSGPAPVWSPLRCTSISSGRGAIRVILTEGSSMALQSVSKDASGAAIRELTALLGDRISTAQSVREQHGKDESYHTPMPPDAVVFVALKEKVSATVKTCAHHGAPVIAFGTGTGLEGNVTAMRGGVCIDLSRMNAILGVKVEDLDASVQAGVTRKQLNAHLRDTGLFFPIDPGADASLGGMAATRASGTNAVRYGTMRENVLALNVVLADGSVIRTARRARKSAAGYDLTRLFVGSEGTLGIITELTLRLYGIPEAMSSAVCAFGSLDGAVNTVIQTIQAGIPIARIELVDDEQIDAVNRFSKLDLPVAPTLFLEFHGSTTGVREQAETVGEIAAGFGGGTFKWTTREEERSRLWQARHDVAYACKALRPGAES